MMPPQRKLDRKKEREGEGTYDDGAGTGDGPAYTMCIPVRTVRAPEAALLDGLCVI